MMEYVKVEFFIPKEHMMPVIEALNSQELLHDGNYDYCFAYTPVKGHFRPLDQANPFIGEVGEMTQVDEVKVECRIPASELAAAKELITKHHPYEVPVINFIALL